MTKEKERTKNKFDTLIKRKEKSQGLDKSKKQMKKKS